MNIYRVCSEELTAYTYIDWGINVPEPYCIYELVAAESPGEAKWAAWKTDKDSYSGSARDMPRFSVVRTRANVDLPPGIISNPRAAWHFTAKELYKARDERRINK